MYDQQFNIYKKCQSQRLETTETAKPLNDIEIKNGRLEINTALILPDKTSYTATDKSSFKTKNDFVHV